MNNAALNFTLSVSANFLEPLCAHLQCSFDHSRLIAASLKTLLQHRWWRLDVLADDHDSNWMQWSEIVEKTKPFVICQIDYWYAITWSKTWHSLGPRLCHSWGYPILPDLRSCHFVFLFMNNAALSANFLEPFCTLLLCWFDRSASVLTTMRRSTLALAAYNL